MSQRVTRRRVRRNLKPLPLLEWAVAQRLPASRPSLQVRQLQAQGFSLSMARLYACLSGYPVEEE